MESVGIEMLIAKALVIDLTNDNFTLLEKAFPDVHPKQNLISGFHKSCCAATQK